MSSNITISDDKDKVFHEAITILAELKLVRGGQALYSTLRKRKLLRTWLNKYIDDNFGGRLDDIEESIANF